MFEDHQNKPKQKKFNTQKGYCLSCRAKLEHGSFCDDLCKEDWEFEQEIRKILGKPQIL